MTNMSEADEAKHTIISGVPKTSEQQHPVNQLPTSGVIDETSVPSVSVPDAALWQAKHDKSGLS